MPASGGQTHDNRLFVGALIASALAVYRIIANRRRRKEEERAIRGGGPDRHGRRAAWPSEIPRRGWWDILMRVKDGISNKNLSLIAAGAAFYAFMAIPSGFAA